MAAIAKPLNQTPPHFIREEPYRTNGGELRYHVFCRCTECGDEFQTRRSGLARGRELCTSCLARKHMASPEVRRKISDTLRQRYIDDPSLSARVQAAMIGRRPTGEKHWNWNGGSIAAYNQRDRKSEEYRNWRQAVFFRDDFTCRICGERGGSLVAHHVKPWYRYEQFRFMDENGLTVCSDCHVLIHRYIAIDEEFNSAYLT